ncbi:MAG TPA: hypothetical protein VGD60_11435 [Candidatus Acidoferrales bacterium]
MKLEDQQTEAVENAKTKAAKQLNSIKQILTDAWLGNPGHDASKIPTEAIANKAAEFFGALGDSHEKAVAAAKRFGARLANGTIELGDMRAFSDSLKQ